MDNIHVWQVICHSYQYRDDTIQLILEGAMHSSVLGEDFQPVHYTARQWKEGVVPEDTPYLKAQINKSCSQETQNTV